MNRWHLILAATCLVVWTYIALVLAGLVHACDHDLAASSDSARIWIEGTHVLGSGTADVYLIPADSTALVSDTLKVMVRHLAPVWSSWVVVYMGAAIDTAWQSIRSMPSQPLLWWKPNCCSPWLADTAGQLLDSGIARAAVVFNYGSDGRIGTLELGRIVVRNHSASVGSRIWIALDNPGQARQLGSLSVNHKPVLAAFDCPSEVQHMNASGSPSTPPRLYRGGTN